MGLTRTVPPATDPISLDEVKGHLRIDHDDEDALVKGMIVAATDVTERMTGRALITSTFVLTLDRFSNVMCLPNPNLIAVASIQYIDTDGATQTLSTDIYNVFIDSTIGRVELDPDESWPSTKLISNAVTITYTAGYGTKKSDVPHTLKLAIRQLVGVCFRDRESSISSVAHENAIFQNLIASEKVVRVV